MSVIDSRIKSSCWEIVQISLHRSHPYKNIVFVRYTVVVLAISAASVGRDMPVQRLLFNTWLSMPVLFSCLHNTEGTYLSHIRWSFAPWLTNQQSTAKSNTAPSIRRLWIRRRLDPLILLVFFATVIDGNCNWPCNLRNTLTLPHLKWSPIDWMILLVWVLSSRWYRSYPPSNQMSPQSHNSPTHYFSHPLSKKI